MSSLGEQMPSILSQHGVTTVFGIPGVQTLEFFRGIGAVGIQHILNRNETGAAFAADGYARSTGRPGVCLLISGPGLTNAATAVAQALHDSVPVLIVSAAPPTSARPMSGALHQLPDQLAFMQTITRRAWHVEAPQEVPARLAEAFELFSAGRPGPVHIQIPADILVRDSPILAPQPVRATPPVPTDDLLDEAASRLLSSTRPVVLAGGGAAGAAEELRGLIEAIPAPVVLTINGKGSVPDDHPLNGSTTLPSAATLDLLDDADVVVAVGTEFSEVDTYYAGRSPALGGALIRIDIDEHQLDHPRVPEIGLVGDSRSVMASLAERVRARRPVDQAALEHAASRAAEVRTSARWWPRAEPLLPLVERIDAAFPDELVVASDSTQLGYIGQHVWRALRPRTWMVPSGWGTLGCALPMAIGAAVGNPDCAVAAIAGDGGLLFTAGELATAADLSRQLLLILWNNSGYEEMRDEYRESGIAPIGVDAHARDYAAIGRGFGWLALRPSTLNHVQPTIEHAFSVRDQPVLVELTPELLR